MTARVAGILVLVGFVATATAQESKMQIFTSKEGKFTVLLPKKPQEIDQSKDTAVGKVEVRIYVVEETKEKAYFAAYNDYPAGTVTPANRDQLLEGGQAGALQSLKGKLLSQKKVSLGKEKHPGKEFTVQLPQDGVFYRARIFIVGDRLYQVFLIGNHDFITDENATSYLGSFRLTAGAK